MKKIYIAGCGGMLGEAFYHNFKDDFNLKCSDIDVNEKWISFLDFRNYENYKNDIVSFNPDFLFHLGAYTDLEFCELNPEDTYITNTEPVKYAVKIANHLSIPILYISSAGIFDGKKDYYDETDKPNPIGHYAKSKYLGEKHVIDHAKKYLICRAGWMMGGGPKKEKKFIKKIIQKIKAGEKELFIVNDKLGTPTYTHDFAKNVKLLIKKSELGLFNMACSGSTSRLEIAFELINFFNLTNEIKITEVESNYFSKDYFVERPNSERMINKKLNDLGLNIMNDWKDSLIQYLNNYYYDYL
jgi:dTDP-4-dehydrorhamnose reductase